MDDDYSSSKEKAETPPEIIEGISDAECGLKCLAVIASIGSVKSDTQLRKNAVRSVGAQFVQFISSYIEFDGMTNACSRAYVCK